MFRDGRATTVAPAKPLWLHIVVIHSSHWWVFPSPCEGLPASWLSEVLVVIPLVKNQLNSVSAAVPGADYIPGTTRITESDPAPETMVLDGSFVQRGEEPTADTN
jgi:hypothetical protein